MVEEPGGNRRVQQRWSDGGSRKVRDAARRRVDEAMKAVRSAGLPARSVVIVGSQRGFEALRFREHGVKVLCVEIVTEFVDACRRKGFDCEHTAVEEWKPRKFDGVYASHVLEHCYDVERAVKVVMKAARHWCYVAAPIEPNGTSDKAHLSSFKNKKKLTDLFKPWHSIKLKNNSKGFRAVFLRRGRGNILCR